jgi:hypothetical protein
MALHIANKSIAKVTIFLFIVQIMVQRYDLVSKIPNKIENFSFFCIIELSPTQGAGCEINTGVAVGKDELKL